MDHHESLREILALFEFFMAGAGLGSGIGFLAIFKLILTPMRNSYIETNMQLVQERISQNHVLEKISTGIDSTKRHIKELRDQKLGEPS